MDVLHHHIGIRHREVIVGEVPEALDAQIHQTAADLLGTVAGPHPFPAMVRDFQKIIGEEAKQQLQDWYGIDHPDAICACVGGGCAGAFSSIMGLAATGMSITAIPGMLLYLNGQLPQYLIACAIGFVVAFVLTTVFYKPKEN